eukprot:1143508-Pelagomonas_calceolata.AAC.4
MAIELQATNSRCSNKVSQDCKVSIWSRLTPNVSFQLLLQQQGIPGLQGVHMVPSATNLQANSQAAQATQAQVRCCTGGPLNMLLNKKAISAQSHSGSREIMVRCCTEDTAEHMPEVWSASDHSGLGCDAAIKVCQLSCSTPATARACSPQSYANAVLHWGLLSLGLALLRAVLTL